MTERKIKEVRLITESFSNIFEDKVNDALFSGFEVNEEISKFNVQISHSGLVTYTILLFRYK